MGRPRPGSRLAWPPRSTRSRSPSGHIPRGGTCSSKAGRLAFTPTVGAQDQGQNPLNGEPSRQGGNHLSRDGCAASHGESSLIKTPGRIWGALAMSQVSFNTAIFTPNP